MSWGVFCGFSLVFKGDGDLGNWEKGQWKDVESTRKLFWLVVCQDHLMRS